MAENKKRFSEDFTQWVGALPTGVRLMIEHPVTGEEYWISREKFLEGYSSGGNSTVGGATAYEIYAVVTSDNPILSERDWIKSLYGKDGETPYVGPNGNWWTGTTDTGIRAQSTVITPTITISGIKKGMTIEWFDPDNIPTGFVLSDGNYKNNFAPINGITIPDKRGVTDRGYDPDALASPEHTDGSTENYGKVGNTGGEDSHAISQDELPPTFFYIFANSNDPGDNTLDSNPLAPPVWSTNHKKGNQDYDIYAKPGAIASIGVTNTIGKGVKIPMRPKYRVACYITKISDDDQSAGENSFVDPVAGTNVSIDKTNANRPVISVDFSSLMKESEFVGPQATRAVFTSVNAYNATKDALGRQIDLTYSTKEDLALMSRQDTMLVCEKAVGVHDGINQLFELPTPPVSMLGVVGCAGNITAPNFGVGAFQFYPTALNGKIITIPDVYDMGDGEIWVTYFTQIPNLALSAKENISNKITAFPENPTDSEYPSAKLVKDTINATKAELESNKTQIIYEQAIGVKNGVNRTFTTSKPPINRGAMLVILSGGILIRVISLNGNEFVIDYDVYPDSDLEVRYLTNVPDLSLSEILTKIEKLQNPEIIEEVPVGVIDDANCQFTLSFEPRDIMSINLINTTYYYPIASLVGKVITTKQPPSQYSGMGDFKVRYIKK